MENNKKDVWDILNIVTTLLIAGMVGYWGYININTQEKNQKSFNDKMSALEIQRLDIEKISQEYTNIQAKLELELKKQEQLTSLLNKDEDQLTHKLAVVQTLIPPITNNEKTRKIALIALAKLGAGDIAIEFSSVYEDNASKEAGDIILQHGRSAEQDQYPEPKQIKSTIDTTRVKAGWMYLGRRKDNQWVGNYTELDNSKTLKQLAGEVVVVKEGVSGVNIRTDYPSYFGKLRPVIDTLKPGSQVKIGTQTHNTYNDFIWVKVVYSEPKS